jgi:hypothetical protein
MQFRGRLSNSSFPERLSCVMNSFPPLRRKNEIPLHGFLRRKKLNALSATESQVLDDESLAYDETLRKRGHFITAQALDSVRAATTVRLGNGKVSVTDGPFAETNEQIGGFILIEAQDLNEAIQLAGKIPAIRLGGIEVRPIKTLTSSKPAQ